MGVQNSQIGDSEAGGEKPAVTSRGRALTPDVRNVDDAHCVAVLATAQCCNSSTVVC